MDSLVSEKNWNAYFECQYYLCVSYLFVDRNINKAEDSLRHNLNLAEEKAGLESLPVAEMLFGLGWLHDGPKQELNQTEVFYRQALAIHEKLLGDNHKKTAKSLANLAQALTSQQKFGEAEVLLKRALAAFDQVYIAGARERIRLYRSAFYFYFNLAEYEKAWSYAQAIADIVESGNIQNQRWVGESYRMLSLSLFELYRHEEALAYAKLEEGFILNNPNTGLNDLVGVYNNIGRVSRFIDLDESVRYAELALELKRKKLGLNHESTIRSMNNLANANFFARKLEKAQQVLDKLFEVIGSSPAPFQERMRAYSYQAMVYSNTNQLDKLWDVSEVGINQYLTGIENRGPNGALVAYIDCIVQLINHVDRMSVNEIHKLETHFMTGDSLVTKLWQSVDIKLDQEQFIQAVSGFYDEGVELYYQLYQQTNDNKFLNRLIYASERSRSALSMPAFLMANRKDRIFLPDSIEQTNRTLLQKIETLETDKSSDKQLLLTIKEQRDSLVDYIKYNYPKYYKERFNHDLVTIEQIQEGIDQNEYVVNYVLTTHNLITLIIGKYEVWLIRNAKGNIVEDVEKIMGSIKNKSDINAITVKLYNSLWGGVVDKVGAGNKVFIVQSGNLNYLPFELLKATSESDFIFHNQPLQYAQSLTLLVNKLKMDAGSVEKMVIVSGSFNENDHPAKLETLENSKIEADQIIKTLNIYPTLKINTKEKLMEEMARADIIHFATHAITDNISPSLSRLVLSGYDEEQVYAYELYNNNIKSQLVTLSACNTGGGKMLNGEGVQSLAKAFTYAGSPNIVMSLWPVNDQSTSELMTYFYTNLKDGMAKDEALRQAKLSYLENADPVKSHPYYWAGFVFSGNPEPLEFNDNYDMIWWLLAVVFLIVVVAVFKSGRFKATG